MSKEAKKAPVQAAGAAKGPDPNAVEQVSYPNFDLEGYVSSYTGLTKIRRLLYIAQRCPEVSLKAYRQAIDLSKQGLNLPLYQECVQLAREQHGSALDDKWGLDPKWMDTARRSGQEKLTKFEAVVAEAKRIGDAEPTMLALWDLADHFSNIGDFQKAQAKLLESKSFDNGDPIKGIKTCLKIIECSINIGTMNYVKNQAGRAQGFHQLKDHPVWVAQISAALGLQHLKQKAFYQAALNFLGTSVDIEGKYPEVISGRDVAVYGVVCGLSQFSRRELQEKVNNNEEFKKLLEMLPEWKQVIQDFQSSNYARCFKLLNRLKLDMKLDIYLGPHIDELVNQIMEKGLVQYFRPFTSVKIPKMAAAFEMPVADLERSLINLISENRLQGRIDSHNKVLHARHADQRSATFQQVLHVGETYVRECQSMLLRMALVEHNFIVRPPQEGRKRDDDRDDA